MRGSNQSYSLTDSHDNMDDSGDFSNDGAGGGSPNKRGRLSAHLSDNHYSSKSIFRFNLKIKERLFLYAYDLIDLNSFQNYFIFCLFLVVDYIFIAYYPLNQIYADFVVPVRPSASNLQSTLMGGTSKVSQTILPNTSYFSNITNGTLMQNDTIDLDAGSGGSEYDRILSTISTSYDKLKGTGLYAEEIRYEKRFANENRDSIVTQILSYINLDYILDNIDFESFVVVQSYFCHAIIAIVVLNLAMIVTRRPDTITLSGQRRLLTKFFSFIIVASAKCLQLPLTTFLLKIFSCSDEVVYFDRLLNEIEAQEAKAASQQSSLANLAMTFATNATADNSTASTQQTFNTVYEKYCYTGGHMNQVVYLSIVVIIYYSLVCFFHYFLTLSYPHEKLPWACLPTKVPILREFLKFFIVLCYQETNISRNGLSYINIVFTVLWLAVVYQRIKHVLIFDLRVYKVTLLGEACLFVIFMYASLRDFIAIDRNFILHALLFASCGFVSYTVILMRERVRQQSLGKVDFALYEKDFEALIMMFTLHELIEKSGYEEAQDFLLRGFIERHIEICEFPQCSCIRYYQISNQNHRLELAQLSPFSRVYDSNQQMTSNANLPGMNTRGVSGMVGQVTQSTMHILGGVGGGREQSDGDELSTIKNLFGGSQKNKIKQNKKKSKYLKQFLIDNINVFLDIFPGSVKLHIMAAFIYFNIFKNSFKSLYELSFTRSKKSSLQDKYECFVLSTQVIAYFQGRANQGISNQPSSSIDKQSKEDKKAAQGGPGQPAKKAGEFNSASFEVDEDIRKVIEFEKVNIQFQKSIEVTSILTRKFWQEILKKNIDVGKVFGLGARIYKNFVDIKRQYKYLMSQNNNYLEVAYLYKLFVSLILNFEIEVEDAKLEIVKIMQKKSMKKHNIKAEYKTIQHSEENGMIIISGQTGNFGRILAMNNKAERTFGYGTNELMGQKLDRLMPRMFASTHEDLILNFINGNRRISKENHQFVWGKHKSKFIMPLIMEINAYVNFEFNFCFIAFLKKSMLLDFKPMRELFEYSEVYVMQASANGIIQDMTQNMQDQLNFPLQALQKDISIEDFFKDIFEDEMEQAYMNCRKVEFDPSSIRRILESKDIDARGDGDDDVVNGNFLTSEKRCVAFVWLRNIDYNEQEVKLAYKELWFFVTDAEESMFETRHTTDAGTAGMDGEQKGNNVTYTEDREEICSIASMSSLANYDKNRKNIMAKLSEIKTQTIDDQKPRQIDLLQKAIILVFLAVISIALLLLVVATDRNTQFFTNLDIINLSKEAAIYFGEIRLMLSSIVLFRNSRFKYERDANLWNLDQQLLQSAREDIEELRKIQSYLNFVDFDYSETTLSKKKSMIYDYMQIRSNKIIESQAGNISMIQGLQEFLDVSNDITAERGSTSGQQLTSQQIAQLYADFIFDTSILNYDASNSSMFTGKQIQQTAINFYQLLKNGHGSLGNYLLQMSERYNEDAIYQANNNSSLVLILTIVSIAITVLTAFIILPILHKIERSKEKVLMIYTELKKDEIESLNRNIKQFFLKLSSGAQQVSGSLSYQTSNRQFSKNLVTRKYTMNPGSNRGRGNTTMGETGGLVDEFGFMSQGQAVGGLGLDSGNDLLDLSGGKSTRNKAKNAAMGLMRDGLSVDPFAALYPSSMSKPQAQSPSGQEQKKSKRIQIIRNLSQRSKLQGKGKSHAGSDQEGSDDDEEHDGKRDEEGSEELSDNAEEDRKAQQLESKEEAENALFKRLFQNKIKQMTCMRQVKYYLMVTIISMIMCGYFTLSYFMVTQIFQDSQESLEIFKIAGNRGPFLDGLLSFFIQTQLRNQETYVEALNDNIDGLNSDPVKLNSLDYYFNLTQVNENDYSQLRRSTPGMISGSSELINGLESQQMCNWLIDDDYVKLYNTKFKNLTSSSSQQQSSSSENTKVEKAQLLDDCNQVGSKLLQLGLQQTINTIVQAVLQGSLQFRDSNQGSLLKQDKEQQLFLIIYVKIRYLNRIDRVLLTSIKSSINDYFTKQQSNYQVVFSVFLSLVVIAMIVLSYYGVEYLFKNLIAIKFILNFIPGQWLIENNAAEDLKYVEF